MMEVENRCVAVTCGGSGRGGEVVDVSVDEGQLVDDVTAQSSLRQHAAPRCVDGAPAFAGESEGAVAAKKVLTQVDFGAAVPEAAAAVRTGAAATVIVHAHLRQEVTHT